jgi:hypothetical protein
VQLSVGKTGKYIRMKNAGNASQKLMVTIPKKEGVQTKRNNVASGKKRNKIIFLPRKKKLSGLLIALELKSLPIGQIYPRWSKLSTKDKDLLYEYIQKELNIQNQRLTNIFSNAQMMNHFPPLMAKWIYYFTQCAEKVEGIDERLVKSNWFTLNADQKIILIWNLLQTLPHHEDEERIFDIILEEEDYEPPIVLMAKNELAIASGNFEQTIRKYISIGWQNLDIDERIVLTNGLYLRHHEDTKNEHELLYSIRAFNEQPPFVFNGIRYAGVDEYLNGSRIPHIAIFVYDHFHIMESY